MTKEEFIDLLKKHASTAGIFKNRFVCVSDDNNHWEYKRPAIDVLEPSIDLSNDGFVLYYPNIGFGDNTVKEISYEDFIAKYNLNRE